jgi:hypothetical protein
VPLSGAGQDDALQLAEFLGLAPAKASASMTTTATQNMHRAAAQVGAALSPKSAARKLKSLNENAEEPPCALWKESRVYRLCRKVCWELTFSIDPFELFKTIRGIKHQEAKLCSLFCFSAWMAPVIPDYADIGAYSMATKAQLYRRAAERMPKMILEASFGDQATLRTMQSFIEQWESAEQTLTADDTKLLRDLSKKDRGPFLYWLINERR